MNGTIDYNGSAFFSIFYYRFAQTADVKFGVSASVGRGQ